MRSGPHGWPRSDGLSLAIAVEEQDDLASVEGQEDPQRTLRSEISAGGS